MHRLPAGSGLERRGLVALSGTGIRFATARDPEEWSMSGKCEGMVALVTGASQGGAGTGLAIRLAAEGAKVGITARSQEGLERTRKAVEELGGEALVMPCDLGKPDGGRETLVARTEAAFGPLDILVNEPAAYEFKPVHEWTLDQLRQAAELNIWAYWMTMAQVIPGMRDRGRGWILNFTSVSGEFPPGPPFALKARDGSSMYGAAKAAINRVTISAAGENYGVIAVNALTPQIAGGRAFSMPDVPDEICEPAETMVEAGFALITGDPSVLTGRIAYSLQLIVELDIPVYDFTGKDLVEGWQPADVVANIKADERFHAGNDWPDVFDFHRVNTPYPDVLRDV
jgi:NAD(P)-dependent dehydrogenase (short-subunit alcohol dehydrogenase family)